MMPSCSTQVGGRQDAYHHVSVCYGACLNQQLVCQRALSMVNVSDDGKIPYPCWWHLQPKKRLAIRLCMRLEVSSHAVKVALCDVDTPPEPRDRGLRKAGESYLHDSPISIVCLLPLKDLHHCHISALGGRDVARSQPVARLGVTRPSPVS